MPAPAAPPPTGGRQSPRPPDPGLRPASPPLRGPFASSGFLTDRRDAPSLARTRLFATSLSLVLKSLIRSAVLTASLPAVIFSLKVWSFIATGVRASLTYWLNHRQPPFFACIRHFIRFLSGFADSGAGYRSARQRYMQKTKRTYRRWSDRGVRSAEKHPEAGMSRQDVGERTGRAREGASGRSAGSRA